MWSSSVNVCVISLSSNTSSINNIPTHALHLDVPSPADKYHVTWTSATRRLEHLNDYFTTCLTYTTEVLPDNRPGDPLYTHKRRLVDRSKQTAGFAWFLMCLWHSSATGVRTPTSPRFCYLWTWLALTRAEKIDALIHNAACTQTLAFKRVEHTRLMYLLLWEFSRM